MRILITVLTVLSVVLVEPSYAEENISIDQLPQAVVDAVKKKFPDAQLREAERNEEKGQLIYEVDISVHGAKKEVEVTPAGKILEVGAGD
jgi:uncharacterized membrane protein YkoI